ncbi:allophanate hydrolase [Poseidonibacter lekithochrous]|uniref:allophanate hydrolase n=1 Tax=Poseidonibacter TaxID=2321187 RepID=UPI001C080685|nr:MULTISPECIES: allophanate hydrolase [Poseidonibacter]MBU3015828.1 allophanate hydrolase [Poseidonibacter lekithochrous]MDO6829127.1 allophanate hydrolase [Poseidonibacter sp. 1_MG-2023]
MNLNIDSLRENYINKTITIQDVLSSIKNKIKETKNHNIWIYTLSDKELEAYIKNLETKDPKELPLYGIPFAIKDNIDLENIPTTAGCKEYKYTPKDSAFVVSKLIEAGAIPIGKTNLDQFATGLVGTRSPYGECKNSINPEYISGGSSSGSAVSVALDMVSFSLGTDTAGSGRVPAAFNNLIGLKATKGVVSTSGVVPACRSLDCVTVFAKDLDDIESVFEIVNKYDEEDIYSREYTATTKKAKNEFTFAIPQKSQLKFFGDEQAKQLFFYAIKKFESLGGKAIEIDYEPFNESANLLYSGPWVTERYIAIKDTITKTPQVVEKTVRAIISGGNKIDAINYFESEYTLKKNRKYVNKIFTDFDFLLTPTTGTIYKIDEVNNDPIQLNTNLGYYTNYMNLLDLSAIAVPAGFRDNGLPFGVTIVADAFEEEKLLSYSSKYLGV